MSPKRRTEPKPKRNPSSTEQRLLAIARDGVILRAKALDSELTPRMLDRTLATGFIDSLGNGVYLLAGRPLEGRTADRAAMEVSRGACLGLWSAAWSHGATNGKRADRPQILVPHGRRICEADWYEIRRTRRLDKREVVTRNGLKTSRFARAVRDLAATLSREAWADEELARLIEEGLVVRATTLRDLRAAVEAERCTWIAERLGRLVEFQAGHDPAAFKSEGERWLRDLVRRLGLPELQYNVRPPGAAGEVDAYSEHPPLIIEFDGFGPHRNRRKFDRDRRRDRIALRNGIPTMRITKTDFDDDLPALEADVIRMLTRAA